VGGETKLVRTALLVIDGEGRGNSEGGGDLSAEVVVCGALSA
jgi:hypothetical protein